MHVSCLIFKIVCADFMKKFSKATCGKLEKIRGVAIFIDLIFFMIKFLSSHTSYCCYYINGEKLIKKIYQEEKEQ